jgi:hypothetical protein
MALYITEEQYNSGANTLEAKGLMALSSVISLLRCSNDEGGCAILVGLMVHLFFPTQGVVGFEPTRLSPISSQPTAFATQPHAQHKLNTKIH